MDSLYVASERKPNSHGLNKKENLLACLTGKHRGNGASGKVSSSSSKDVTKNLVSFYLSSQPSAGSTSSLRYWILRALILPAVGRTACKRLTSDPSGTVAP